MNPKINQVDNLVSDGVSDIVRESTVGSFRGDYPDVPTHPDVDMQALQELDEKPLFVTLPVVPKVGTISSNGLLYDDALLDDIAGQINSKRPGANFGHLPEQERDTAFPKPDAIWVGALRVGETLWGKAYIRPGEAREYIRTLKAVNGSISTSIYGQGVYEKVAKGVRRLKQFNLDTLDFAPPARAALGGGVTPKLTAEMTDEESQEKDIMDKAQVIAELTVADIPDALRELFLQNADADAEASKVVTELETTVAARDAKVSELEATIAEYKSETFKLQLDEKIGELYNWPVVTEGATAKLSEFKALVRKNVISELDENASEEDIDEALVAVGETLKGIAETLRDVAAGPPAVVGARKKAGQRTLDTSPAAIAVARAKYNLGE